MILGKSLRGAHSCPQKVHPHGDLATGEEMTEAVGGGGVMIQLVYTTSYNNNLLCKLCTECSNSHDEQYVYTLILEDVLLAMYIINYTCHFKHIVPWHANMQLITDLF